MPARGPDPVLGAIKANTTALLDEMEPDHLEEVRRGRARSTETIAIKVLRTSSFRPSSVGARLIAELHAERGRDAAVRVTTVCHDCPRRGAMRFSTSASFTAPWGFCARCRSCPRRVRLGDGAMFAGSVDRTLVLGSG